MSALYCKGNLSLSSIMLGGDFLVVIGSESSGNCPSKYVTKIWVMIIEGEKMRINGFKIRAAFHIELHF